MIDIPLIDRDARVLLADHQLAQLFEGGVGGNGHDAGSRRHDFTHHGVPEFDHRLHQLAVLFSDEPFFRPGGDKSLDVFGGSGGLFRGGAGVGELDERLEEPERGHARAGGPGQGAQQRRQRHEPLRTSAAVEQLRHGIGGDGHGEPSRQRGLPDMGPGARVAIHEPCQVEDAQQGQQGVLDERESAGAVLGLQAELVFERRLKELERRQIPGPQTEAFEVEQLHEGDQRQQGNGGESRDGEGRDHDFTRSMRPSGKPKRRRQRFSARAIRPASAA
jgi:hypothetical protein